MQKCCPTKTTCSPWDLTKQDKTNCYADQLSQETLNIAGAILNVHKLLGIHEQVRLQDETGLGSPISGGDQPSGPASSAFNMYDVSWRSLQVGAGVPASSYVGYDFGVKKLPSGRVMYGVTANVSKQIGSFSLKQGQANRRASRVRIERSDDGNVWYGVSVVTLINDGELNMYQIKTAPAARFWRLRPLAFLGNECDVWEVYALQLHEYAPTHTTGIQDLVLLENRDRDYASSSLELKCYYDFVSNATDLSRFGVELPSANYQIKVNFTACVSLLGRPIIVGDILQLPSETQYSASLTAVLRYLEVTDVTWDTGSFTPGWLPTMLLVTAQPALASQETQDIFGDLGGVIDASGLLNANDGNNTTYQDKAHITQAIRADAISQVSERGSEGSNTVREFEPSEVAAATSLGVNVNKVGFNRRGLYVEDAIPQNGQPFTQGPSFPTSPNNGDYHRITYEGLAGNVPARLYRWSSVKNNWVYLETDKRALYNAPQPIMQEYIQSHTTFGSDIK